MFVSSIRTGGRRWVGALNYSRQFQQRLVRFNTRVTSLNQSYSKSTYGTWTKHPIWYYQDFKPIQQEYLELEDSFEKFKKLKVDLGLEDEGFQELLNFWQKYSDYDPATELQQLEESLDEVEPPSDVFKEVDDEIVEHCQHFKDDKPQSVKSECPCNTGSFLLGIVKGMGSVVETVSGFTESLAKLVGWSESDVEAPAVKERKLAVDTLKGVIEGDNGKMSCAAVMITAVEPFYKAMGEIFAAGIGSHYVERLDAIKLMPTDKNLKSIADGENVYWGEQGWTNLGAWIQGDTRLNMLKESRKEWFASLTDEQKRAFNEAQESEGSPPLT